MGRRMWLAALLGLVFTTCGPSVASAADLFGFRLAIGQGTTTFRKQTKFKAKGTLSFKTNVDGVTCRDSLSLERRVKEVSHRQIRYRWVLIRGGAQELRCSRTPPGGKPASEQSSQAFLNDPTPYRHLLDIGPLRLRYQVSVSANGHLAYRQTLISPVTSKTLSQPFRTTAP